MIEGRAGGPARPFRMPTAALSINLKYRTKINYKIFIMLLTLNFI